MPSLVSLLPPTTILGNPFGRKLEDLPEHDVEGEQFFMLLKALVTSKHHMKTISNTMEAAMDQRDVVCK
jgi:hypothetical protein